MQYKRRLRELYIYIHSQTGNKFKDPRQYIKTSVGATDAKSRSIIKAKSPAIQLQEYTAQVNNGQRQRYKFTYESNPDFISVDRNFARIWEETSCIDIISEHQHQ